MNRILHVVPYLSADMRFGGPVRVAFNIATEQHRRGADVEIIGAGETTEEIELEGHAESHLRAQAFRSVALARNRPYTSRISVSLWIWMLREVDRETIVHLHMGRDPVSLVAGLIATRSKKLTIVQTHGMIERRTGILGTLDKILVGRVVRSAKHTLALTETEAEHLRTLGQGRNITVFANGTPISKKRPKPDEYVRVLFLARLHPRKGAIQFARVACLISARHPQLNLSFHIAGPDEGDLAEVRKIIATSPRVAYIGPQTSIEAAEQMHNSHIYVLPASGEPFGMTILEALATRNAVVLSHSAALAAMLVRAEAAVAFDGSDESLINAIEELVLNRDIRDALGAKGCEFVEENFSIHRSVLELQSIYESTLEGLDD